jgi:hypothetical protein
MDNVVNTGLHTKAMNTVRGAAVLLLLRRTLSDTVTFCSFEETRKPTRAEQRRWEQKQGGNLVSGNWLAVGNQVLISASHTRESS